MKKFTQVCMSIVLMLASIIILSACKPKITSAYVKSGTLNTTIVKGEELDTSHVVVVYNYSDDSIVEVSAENLQFGTIDSNTIGTQKLKIIYNDYSFEVNIKVVATEADVNSITSLESELLNEFNERRQTMDEKEKFVFQNEPLYVGDDNPFDFRIFATGIDGNNQLQTNITKVRTNIEVKIKGQNEILTGEELENYVTIDTENTTLDFKESAIDKTFEIKVSAVNVNPLYAGNKTSFTAEVTVIDGYNVYTAKDLSVYDNKYSSYDSIRPTNNKVNAVILQNDITITKDDVRSDIFWKTSDPKYNSAKIYTDQVLEGTPKDLSDTGIYHRQLKSGETFGMYGNYFKIDLSTFPKMVVEGDGGDKIGVSIKDGGYMTSHFSLFYNENISEVTETNKNSLSPSNLIHKNIYFFGNGELNAKPENSGAIILNKSYKTNYLAKNNIAHNFYMSYFFSQDEDFADAEGYNIINSCKAYNSYQCLIYTWGCKDLKIVDSVFENAGGPAIIADHVKPDKENGGYPSHINIINSKIQSIISGKEPWFATYNASSLVTSLITADQLFTGFTKNESDENVSNTLPQNKVSMIHDYIKDNNNKYIGRVNLIVAMKSGSAQSLTAERIEGYVRKFDTIDDYNAYYGIGVEASKTVFGLDMTKESGKKSLMDKAFGDVEIEKDDDGNPQIIGGCLYFESSKSGGYINTNIANGNQDASFVKPVTLFKIINMLEGGDSSLESAFQLKDINSMKETLLAKINKLSTVADAINAIYSNAVGFNLLVEDTSLNVEGKVNALNTLINSFVSHADGRFVNIYIFNGMGAMIELYPVD